VAGGRSNRFLDPVSLDNLHNGGDNQSVFARLDFNPSRDDFLHFMVSSARSRFEVPNLPSQHLAGQDQDQRLMDVAVRVTWLHIFNPRWSLEVIPYYRTALAQLFESPFDTPVTAAQARHLTTTGAKSSISYTAGRHRFKAGIDFFAFPVSEILTFGITDPAFNDPAGKEFNPNLLPHDLTRGGSLFAFDDGRTGEEYSFFIQDNVTYRGLTASLGIRYDNYNFVLDRDHWSPRVGLAYHIAPIGTVVRASFNRLWQTPSNENLLLSTSEQAAGLVPPERLVELGTALIIVEPERVNFWEVGAQQSIRDWLRLDASVYWKRVRTYHDNDQFFNTTVVFPIAISKGRIKGFDLRVDMPARRGLSSYWSFSVGEAIGVPPLTGGLFVGEEAMELFEEGPFNIDHDQTYSSQWGVTYEHESGVWTSLGGRYDSGLPVEIEDLGEVLADPDVNRELALVNLNQDPFRVKSRLVWDWSIGFEYPQEKPRVAFQFDIRNLSDEERLFNYLSVFSGTHVIPPRSFSGRMRYFF
jgi:outer membrane receptor protein involved in Fe transport